MTTEIKKTHGTIAAKIREGKAYTYTHRSTERGGAWTLIYLTAQTTVRVNAELYADTLNELVAAPGPSRVARTLAALEAAGYEASTNK